MNKILFQISETRHHPIHAETLLNKLSHEFPTNSGKIRVLLDTWAPDFYPPFDKFEPSQLSAAYISMILHHSFLLVVMPWHLPADDELIRRFGGQYLGFYRDQTSPREIDFLKCIERIDHCPVVIDQALKHADVVPLCLLQLDKMEEARLAVLYKADRGALIREMAEMLQRSRDYCSNNRPDILNRGFNSAS